MTRKAQKTGGRSDAGMRGETQAGGHEGITPENVIRKRLEHLETMDELIGLLGRIACVALIIWAVFTLVFGISAVGGEGMYPRMRDGDLTLWYRLPEEYNIGDIVTFMIDGERQYGRIVARGGDTVDFSEDGLLLLNGSAQQESVFFETLKDGRSQSFPMTLKDGELFVLGDNRVEAVDSRDYGPVAVAEIDGKVMSLLRRRGL